MKWPRSAAGEDILQWLFGAWLDLSDLSTDREPKAGNSNIAIFRVSVLISLFSFQTFHSPFTSTILRLSTFEAKELMSLENFCFVFTYNLLLWRSIVTCNRCNIVSSHKCLTYTNQTFCTMSFNRKLIKFFGEISRNWEAMFALFLRGRRADFKAHAIIVLRLRTANLL